MGEHSKGARVVEPRGYVLIRVGKNHPLSDCRGYAYEHRLTAYEAGELDPDGPLMHVHHQDEMPGNNDRDNLEVLTPPEHRARHRKPGSQLRDPGEPNRDVPCACGCGATLARYDGEGRPRRFISGHNPHPSPTLDAVVAAIRGADQPLTPTQISAATDKRRRVVQRALWKLKAAGRVVHVARAKWRAGQ